MKKFAAVFLLLGTSLHAASAEMCNTEKHTIIIDQVSQDTFEYREWNTPKTTQSKPDMEMTQKGALTVSATGVCRFKEYRFKKGNVEFVVDDNISCVEEEPPKNAIGNLWVYVGEKMVTHQYCLKK